MTLFPDEMPIPTLSDEAVYRISGAQIQRIADLTRHQGGNQHTAFEIRDVLREVVKPNSYMPSDKSRTRPIIIGS